MMEPHVVLVDGLIDILGNALDIFQCLLENMVMEMNTNKVLACTWPRDESILSISHRPTVQGVCGAPSK